MDMYIWDAYGQEEVNDKIKYWVDLWEDLIENFNKKFYGLNLVNPQLLIKDVIDEIHSNAFHNKENRKYFYKQLNWFLNHDPALKKCFSTDFTLIRREFNSGKNFYLLQICQTVQEIFSGGKYFEESYNILKQILQNPVWEVNDEENISIITQHLIIELLLKGYSLKTIHSFPRRLFDKYPFRGDSLITEYPHNTRWTDFVDGDKFNESAFNEAVKAEIDSLTVPKRLHQFTKYYWSKPNQRYFIFQIEGLKGDVDFNIGIVNFYSPNRKRYIAKRSSRDDDPEYFHGDKNQYFLNAAVQVDDIDTEASKLFATEAIEKALDLIRCYFTPDANFEIVRESYLIVDSEGRKIGSGHSVSQRNKWYRWHNALDLNMYDTRKESLTKLLNGTSKFLFTPLEKQSDIEQKIGYSLHWYRKGEETNNLEDKLLNYWIVIENLMNFKPSAVNIVLPKNEKESRYILAKELVTPIQIRNFIYDVGWELYWYLDRLLNSFQGDPLRPRLALPHEIVEACNLRPKPNTTIELQSLIDNLPKLAKTIDRKVIKKKVIYTQSFYYNNRFANERIKEQMEQIKDDILLIYRYRNRIVHHAHFDTTVLPYFVQKAGKFSGDLLREIVRQYVVNKTDTIEKILVSMYAKMNRIIEKLKKNVPVDFLNLDF